MNYTPNAILSFILKWTHVTISNPRLLNVSVSLVLNVARLRHTNRFKSRKSLGL